MALRIDAFLIGLKIHTSEVCKKQGSSYYGVCVMLPSQFCDLVDQQAGWRKTFYASEYVVPHVYTTVQFAEF